MYFENLPNELVLHVFQSCGSIADVLSLASSSQRFHRVFSASQRLPILFLAAEAQYGPLDDAIQIITHTTSQPAQQHRHAPLSRALLKQLLEIGRIAAEWTQLYPFRKWKRNSEDRRVLDAVECFNVRRAIYRLWLYSRAFHNSRYTRTTRIQRLHVLEYSELLHNWSTAELAEMEDVRLIIRQMLQSQICPSNGTVARKFRSRFPDADHQQQQQLCFNIHLNYPPPSTAATAFTHHFHTTHQRTAAPKHFANVAATRNFKYTSTASHEPGAEGWGDDLSHFYVLEDFLKLDPGQVLWLRDHAPFKSDVVSYVKGLGEWFENCGETFGHTLELVIRERGGDVEELRAEIEDGTMGIARSD